MLKTITFLPGRAEEALATLQSLVSLSTQQLEMCTQVLEELEFSGELQKDFMKRLVGIQGEVRKARVRLKDLATEPLKSDQ